MDRGAWWAAVHRVTKSWIQLSTSTDNIHKYMEIHIYIIFSWILFPYRLLQNIEYRFLCYTIGSYWLSSSCTSVDTSWLSSSYILVYTERPTPREDVLTHDCLSSSLKACTFSFELFIPPVHQITVIESTCQRVITPSTKNFAMK